MTASSQLTLEMMIATTNFGDNVIATTDFGDDVIATTDFGADVIVTTDFGDDAVMVDVVEAEDPLQLVLSRPP